jgi:predicted signal transduction protein with EAL and GGDEF domain
LQKRISAGVGANRQVAVVAIELVRLSRVSASFGQAAATEIMCEVANRFSMHVRDDDIVAQLSHTTLTMVFAAADGEDSVRAVTARLLDELRQPCTTSIGTVTVSGNLGISLCPRDSQHAASLVNNAEAALQLISADESESLRFFSAELQARELHQLNRESDLRSAVQQCAFHLYYQPRVRAASGKIIGPEALLRWNHPHHGRSRPSISFYCWNELALLSKLANGS